MADHWQSRMWQGLMQWVEDEQYVARRRIVAEQARRNIQERLAEDHLGRLTLDEFNEYVWQFGKVYDHDGNDVGDIHQYSADELRQAFESGGWTVTGQHTVAGGTGSYYPAFEGTTRQKTALLRRTLRELLYSSDDYFANFERVCQEPNFIRLNWGTMMLCMMHPDEMGILNGKIREAMWQLAWLLGTEEEWEERINGGYPEFNTLLHEMRDASNGTLSDLLAVDAFLNHIGDMRDPEYWKVALAPNAKYHDELVALCTEQGCAAIGFPDEPDNASVVRLREVQPGDYVVMHTRASIGGVGRVVRPYYEINRAEVTGVAADFWRRIDVEWLLGRHSYGDALPGAKQLQTVVSLDQDVFWRLAANYADDSRFGEVLNPPENWRELAGVRRPSAWVFQANPDRWDFFGAMQRPTPFTEDWAANQQREEMRVGDRVYLWPSGAQAGIHAIATIATEPYETPGDEFGEWKVDLTVERVLDRPLLRATLRDDPRTADLRLIRQPQGTNFPLTAAEAEAIEELLGLAGPTLESTARACCCEPAFVRDIVQQLERKGQVILYGPPGTGKTYVARKVAEYLAGGDEGRVRLIQFHPSYTYEDFMEGIKPEAQDCGNGRWEVSYPVRPGSFMRFCQQAAEDPEGRYVFIIDEINRGQIAKIFGELMYLLEYRGHEIDLAYTKSEGDTQAPERFGIPPNVLIIGTMNTADRSIALVDFALRRRFTFIPFYPDDGAHVQGMLARWLDENVPEMAWVARLVDDLNGQLTGRVGRDFLIGHSYFMQDGLDEALVETIWRYQIAPLLHEYFVGNAGRADEFKLDELMARAKGIAEPVELGEDAEESVGKAEGDAE